jgi:hypothetical protein
MIKKTVATGIAALAVAGVLGGAALTSTAQAATGPASNTASHIAAPHSPQYSKGFNMFNTMSDISLQLVGVQGKHEGAPPIGSSMSYGQFQRFEVQHGERVWATYQLDSKIHGYVGNVEIEMKYGAFWDVSARVALNNSSVGLYISHPGDETWGICIGNK